MSSTFPFGEDVDPESFEWPEDCPPFHHLATAGVESGVYSEEEELLGHCLMADYDDAHLDTVIGDAWDLASTIVVCRSSDGSYHLWDLEPRPWAVVAELLEGLNCSESYRARMLEEGRCVLRTTPKIRRTGETYKEAPQPIHVALYGSGTLSKPHLTRLQQMARSPESRDALAELQDASNLIGQQIRQTIYESMTDELSELLDGGDPDGLD